MRWMEFTGAFVMVIAFPLFLLTFAVGSAWQCAVALSAMVLALAVFVLGRFQR